MADRVDEITKTQLTAEIRATKGGMCFEDQDDKYQFVRHLKEGQCLVVAKSSGRMKTILFKELRQMEPISMENFYR